MKKRSILIGMLTLFLLNACDREPTGKPLQYSAVPESNSIATYHLVPHPLYNPQTLSQIFQPLINHLNANLKGARIELEASRDYQAFEQKFRAREADILLPNPWQTIEAQKVGYQVIAMWGDADDFKGLFIVRKDSNIASPTDLKGKTVSYPSPTALAAAVMPQYFLHKHIHTFANDLLALLAQGSNAQALIGFSELEALREKFQSQLVLMQEHHLAAQPQLDGTTA